MLCCVAAGSETLLSPANARELPINASMWNANGENARCQNASTKYIKKKKELPLSVASAAMTHYAIAGRRQQGLSRSARS